MNAVVFPSWGNRVRRLLAKLPAAPWTLAWRSADVETVRNVVSGASPYSGAIKPDGAARVVFNISSAHIPGFVAEPDTASGGRPYKNRYDVAGTRIVGAIPVAATDVRGQIDQALATLVPVSDWQDLYYGAVELNGAGIRYYGDICLVLKADAVHGRTLVLDRNSFDLLCAPLRERTFTAPGNTWSPSAGRRMARRISGRWGRDIGDMAVCKVLASNQTAAERRITVGMVSEGVLADEDYIEIIRVGSFGVAEVHEGRVSAADAAVDGLIADRIRHGPTPDWSELLWRHRRRRAEEALKSSGVRTRVVVSAGRVRS